MLSLPLGRDIINNMDEKQKKLYVVNSLKFDSGSRISEVVNRYFKSVYSAKNLKKSVPESDIIGAEQVGLV